MFNLTTYCTLDFKIQIPVTCIAFYLCSSKVGPYQLYLKQRHNFISEKGGLINDEKKDPLLGLAIKVRIEKLCHEKAVFLM